MKYLTILGVIAIILAVVVGALLFAPTQEQPLLTESTPVSTPTVAPVEGEVAFEAQAGRGTLEAIRAWGEDVECSISYVPEGMTKEVEGTFFVDGRDIRGDFITPSPDLSGEMVSSMIINDSVMFVWSEIEGQRYGMRMDMSLIEAGSDVDSREPVSFDADVAYDCKPWAAVDRTIFQPPSDVLFQDMSELMQGGMEYGTLYESEGVELP